jgi:hypothetical protein
VDACVLYLKHQDYGSKTGGTLRIKEKKENYIKDQGKEEKLVIDDETCIVIDPAGQTACRYVDSRNDKELPFERECKKNRFPNKNICCDRNMEMSREFLLLTEL